MEKTSLSKYCFYGLIISFSTHLLFSQQIQPPGRRGGVGTITRETARYFQLFPQIPSFRYADVIRANKDGLSLRIIEGDSIRYKEIVLPLSRIDSGALTRYIENYESCIDCGGCEQVQDAMRAEESRLIDLGIISANPKKHVSRIVELWRKDSVKLAGILLYADSNAVYLWPSELCYDWRRAETSIIRNDNDNIHRLIIRGVAHPQSAFIIGVAAGIVGFNIQLIISLLNGTISLNDSETRDFLQLTTTFSLFAGLAAMLVDDLLSMDSEIPIEVKEDGNTNLLLKELRELMYFNDGYPPEFERVINGGRISN